MDSSCVDHAASNADIHVPGLTPIFIFGRPICVESHASASPQGGPVQQGYWQGLQYTEQIPQLSDIGMFSAYYHRLDDGEDEDRPLLVSHAHFIHSFIHSFPPTFALFRAP